MNLRTAIEDYNAQEAGVTAAIVVAILVPVLIFAGCIMWRIRDHFVEKRRLSQYEQ